MKFRLSEEIIIMIKNVLKKYPVDKAVVYGSRARDDYKKTSDIDIAVYSKNMKHDDLNRLRFDSDELDIIYKIDVIHIESVTKQSLPENIGKEGIEIF